MTISKQDKEKILKAGKIASQIRKTAKAWVKKDIPLLEIAEKIEVEIEKLGGKPAFPVNLSINEIAAHYTPSHDDTQKARGLLKVDFGVHIEGWAADNAFTIDLENSEANKKLIEASEQALNKALKEIKKGMKIKNIGSIIQEKIESFQGIVPIVNLSGHSMEEYDLHSGITIPNIDNRDETELSEGLYAIEPFSTTGNGKVHDGKPSGIYQLTEEKTPRSPLARQILEFIKEEYKTLPFCSRWIVKKFGNQSLFALKELESSGILHNYPQLIESSNAKVAQSEHTILIEDDDLLITTE